MKSRPIRRPNRPHLLQVFRGMMPRVLLPATGVAEVLAEEAWAVAVVPSSATTPDR